MQLTFLGKIVLMLLALGALPGAQAPGSSEPMLRKEIVVTTEWLAAHLHDQNLVVLSVGSTPEFYSQGHIPGARQILLSEIAVTRDGIPNELPPIEKLQAIFAAAGVSNHSRVVLYGERANLLAARAYFTLDYLGVAGRASLLDGGMEKWRSEKRPISREAAQARPAKLTIAPRPAILVDTAAMRKLAEQRVALIDARPAKEYTGEQLSEDVQKAGHIPGATSLYWMDMLVSRENPVLRPEEELRRMYTQAHAAAGQPLVTYCRTGMQSSFDYFVAKYLGYEPSMYDASFYEWSLKDLPAETSPKQ
ncbi:MAG TPA: sulfurtransferase [Candidatus Angelobacter sp.]|jgi:thiosulfate/3-mercaptopyruvate sulfurtransferase